MADRAGFAIYGELSAGPSEVELEGKLILDTRKGRFLGALNLGFEQQWSFEEHEREQKVEVDAAACVFLTSRLSLGLELRVIFGWDF